MLNNYKKHYAVIIGARPNFIKAASFFKEAKKHADLEFTLIHTGQHFDNNMSKIFFKEMGIPKPDVFLDIDAKKELHTTKIGKMFHSLKAVLANKNFAAVIVFGDVNSSLAGGIAAAKSDCGLIHIEAGLRSHDRRMPEEINRVILDHLADLLFTSEPSANENLKKEGIEQNKIKYVGNIMIESMEIFWPKICAARTVELLGLKKKHYVIATTHRQENTDDVENLKTILLILNKINNDIPVVFPLHPGTREKIKTYKLDKLLKKLTVTKPLGYFEFMNLIIHSKGVITDSGGIQEETTYLGIPCCTLRDNTERPITLKLGSNKLFTVKFKNVIGIKKHLKKNHFQSKHIPRWDTEVSKRIFKFL